MDQIVSPEPRLPTHQIAYARLRDMVLFGDLAPGEGVTIEGLVARLDLGMTPVREALRRLIAEGALRLLGNRRVCVPVLNARALDDLAHVRLAVEPRLALAALDHVDAGLLAQLRALDEGVDAALGAGDVAGYLRGNHAFHFALYARAGSDVLEGMAAQIWLRFGPSLRVVCEGGGLDQRSPDHHKAVLDALLTRDGAALDGAIRADIAQGMAGIGVSGII